MPERRIATRTRSFLQGRIFYNNRRSSVDCLIRDYSETGAKLKFSESITVPEAVELFVPNKDVIHRARVQWRSGADLVARVAKLEAENIALKRAVNDLRAEIRKQHGEVA